MTFLDILTTPHHTQLSTPSPSPTAVVPNLSWWWSKRTARMRQVKIGDFGLSKMADTPHPEGVAWQSATSVNLTTHSQPCGETVT